MKRIAVVGAGVMGADVALNLSCYQYEVVLKDLDAAALDKARRRMLNEFRMAQMMKSDLKGLQIDDVLGRIDFTTTYDSFQQVDLVIENVSERLPVKEPVYEALSTVCREDILLCANTSCMSITKVASRVRNPGRVVGMHFMNPVPLKDVVELIKGHHTTDETLARARAFLKTLKKTAVVANDFPGFIANRLSHLLMNEAAFLIQDQVAAAKDVDMLFKQGYGHAMGPLETADLIGLDTVVDSLDVLYTNYQDTKFRCCPLLRKMVDAGLTGRKSGEGFYKYNV